VNLSRTGSDNTAHGVLWSRGAMGSLWGTCGIGASLWSFLVVATILLTAKVRSAHRK
jgi:hypothetical protein